MEQVHFGEVSKMGEKNMDLVHFSPFEAGFMLHLENLKAPQEPEEEKRGKKIRTKESRKVIHEIAIILQLGHEQEEIKKLFSTFLALDFLSFFFLLIGFFCTHF